MKRAGQFHKAEMEQGAHRMNEGGAFGWQRKLGRRRKNGIGWDMSQADSLLAESKRVQGRIQPNHSVACCHKGQEGASSSAAYVDCPTLVRCPMGRNQIVHERRSRDESGGFDSSGPVVLRNLQGSPGSVPQIAPSTGPRLVCLACQPDVDWQQRSRSSK